MMAEGVEKRKGKRCVGIRGNNVLLALIQPNNDILMKGIKKCVSLKKSNKLTVDLLIIEDLLDENISNYTDDFLESLKNWAKTYGVFVNHTFKATAVPMDVITECVKRKRYSKVIIHPDISLIWKILPKCLRESFEEDVDEAEDLDDRNDFF